MSDSNEIYTIGWISAIPTELAAARLFFDSEPCRPKTQDLHDTNSYSLGKIGSHNVVMACLPDGEYGTTAAAVVATNMLRSFPNIRFGLMVGIGGGAPSKLNNMRLGDIVVSSSSNGEGGVFQYDFGKSIQNRAFSYTGYLNRPPTALRTAVSDLKAQHKVDGHQYEAQVAKLLKEKKRSFITEYSRPSPTSDKLYKPAFVHLNDNLSCWDLCSDFPEHLEPRPERKEPEDGKDFAVVHYGLIASANQLMKNATIRNELALTKNVLCFEMEAAGLMNNFPCLVIRGICDYSDSHKNKEWQGFAAMMAAAYAKDLLCWIVPSKVEAEKGIREAFECLKSLAFPQMYNRSHDIDPAVTGTCEWLLRHKTYRSWAACDRGLLWIKGKPGSGKSTLLKHTLDNGVVPNAGNGAFVLSFFFHGRGDELQKTPLGLFRSLLHHLLSLVPDALPDLVAIFQQRCDTVGKPGEKWQWHPNELRRFFELSLLKGLGIRPIWLLVDALDECGEQNAVDLVEWFKSLFQSSPSLGLQFRVCFTCRHYPILALEDGAFEICLEHQNREDISTYVRNQLSTFSKRTSSTIPALITARAQGVFMWARLAVKQVEKLEREGEGLGAIKTAIHSIPPDLGELYNALLQSMKPDSLKLIQWICFATRPLSVAELPWAMAVDPDSAHKSLYECRKSDKFIADDKIDRRIKALSCGLAEIVWLSYTQVIQFIHQSVKDFFVENGLSDLNGSLTSTNTANGMAHHRLSKICIRYLAMEEIGQSTSYERRDFPFLHYATTSWVAHAKQGDVRSVRQKDLLECFAWPSNALVDLWVRVYGILNPYSRDCPAEGTTLMHVTSRYQAVGLLSVILQRADQIGTEIDIRDRERRTPLWWAARNGHEFVVKQLLATSKVDVNSKDYWGQTPLWQAAENGHEAVVKQLLATGRIGVNLKEKYGRSPLSRAAENGHEAVVKQLLNTGKADVNSKDYWGQTPLWRAVDNRHEAVVKQLLATARIDVDSKDKYGRTPLSRAAENGHEAVVKQLLDTGKADFNSEDRDGQTPLWWAARYGHKAVVKQLLATSEVNIEWKDRDGWSPLS